MNKIIIPQNILTTEKSITHPNNEINFPDWLKLHKAVENEYNEYSLTIAPKSNRKINYSTLAEGTFNHIKIKGKLILNVFNIDTFNIGFTSSFLLPDNYGLNHITQRNYGHQFSVDNSQDFLFSKELVINANNLNLNLDVLHQEYQDTLEITFYPRDLLPLETLTINCNQSRVFIQNQDIKKIVINNRDIHKFDLILKNLYKLEYLDISNMLRLDLCRYKYNELKPINWIDSDEWRYVSHMYQELPTDSGHINCFNLEFVNPECVIKLNKDLCFYFALKTPVEMSSAIHSIPFNLSENANSWYKVYLDALFDCENKKFIEVKWKTLQEKLLLTINEMMLKQLMQNKKQIKNHFKNLKTNKKED